MFDAGAVLLLMARALDVSTPRAAGEHAPGGLAWLHWFTPGALELLVSAAADSARAPGHVIIPGGVTRSGRAVHETAWPAVNDFQWCGSEYLGDCMSGAWWHAEDLVHAQGVLTGHTLSLPAVLIMTSAALCLLVACNVACRAGHERPDWHTITAHAGPALMQLVAVQPGRVRAAAALLTRNNDASGLPLWRETWERERD